MSEQVVRAFFAPSAYASEDVLQRIEVDVRETCATFGLTLVPATWGETRQPKLCLHGCLRLPERRAVPVQIWLSHHHPVEPPVPYVVSAPFGPATPPGARPLAVHTNVNNPIVDGTGRCHTPALSAWNPRQSSLRAVVQELLDLFTKHSSMFSYNQVQASGAAEQLTPSVKTPVGGDECVICVAGQRDTVVVPCGHYCLCSGCAANISSCPICRTTVQYRQRLAMD